MLGMDARAAIVILNRRVITPKKNAPKVLSSEAVKPGDSIFEAVVALAAQINERAQRAEGHKFGVDPWPSNAFELNVSPCNYARQSESADGGAQHVRICLRTAGH